MDRITVSRKNEFEILILAILIVNASAILISRKVTPGSLNALLPGWWLYGWVGAALLGCITCLVGIFHKSLANGVFIERASIPLVCTSISAIAAAQVLYNGATAIVSASILFFVVGAFIRRHRKLTEVIRQLPRKQD